MWVKRRHITGIILLSTLFLTTISIAQVMPEGKGMERVKSICGLCHGIEVVASQRLNRSEWTDVVERMIKWGAPIHSDDKEIIIDYLSNNFGPEKNKKLSRGRTEMQNILLLRRYHLEKGGH